MTLLLAVATPQYVVTLADRRITHAVTRELIDDFTTKSVIFEDRLAFLYTGLATLERQATDMWMAKYLADNLSSSQILSLDSHFDMLCSRLQTAFRGFLRPALHAVLVSGFARRGNDEGELVPFLTQLDNFRDPDQFSWVMSGLGDHDFLVWHCGQPLDEGLLKQFERSLRRGLKRSIGSRDVITLGAHLIRSVASRNRTVVAT